MTNFTNCKTRKGKRGPLRKMNNMNRLYVYNDYEYIFDCYLTGGTFHLQNLGEQAGRIGISTISNLRSHFSLTKALDVKAPNDCNLQHLQGMKSWMLLC